MEPLLWIGGYILIFLIVWFLILFTETVKSQHGERGWVFFVALFWIVMIPFGLLVGLLFWLDKRLAALVVITKRKIDEYRT